MNRKTILYVNLRSSIDEVRSAILAARNLGHRIILLADKYPDIFKDHFLHIEITDTYDIEQTLQVACDLHEKYKFDGVITWSDRDVELVSKIADALNLPGPEVLTAKKTRNKYFMRESLESLSQLLPKYHKVTDFKSLELAIKKVGFPAVIKPTGASGSKGIFTVKNHQEAELALNKLNQVADPEKDKIFSLSGREFIFEEYLDGDEFSVEGWVFNKNITIAGITDKETTDDFHIEFQHIFPSDKQKYHQNEITQHTKNIIKSLGLDNCPFHLEAKWTSKGFKLVEIAARAGGGYITSHLVSSATDTNFHEEVIKVALGENPKVLVNVVQHSGIRCLLANNAGKLVAVSQLDIPASLPDVTHIFLEKKIGQAVTLPPENFNLLRIASIIVQHPDYHQVLESLNIISNKCEVVVSE